MTTSENRQTPTARQGEYHAMDLDHDACYRAIELRDARFDGRFFTAVRTTGTYCRPVCPARTPRSENVTFYPTAAAAQEAGFRPCLRCRPETAPDKGAWRGTSNTVSRALALIELGALDDGSVDALAGRLGLGERQLRRLCRQHLGASPIAVAQTRRVLLAKQLIHETSLPMAEIAFASGLRQHPPVQRDVPGDVRSCAVHPAARERTGGPGRSGGRDQPAPALSASLRLAGHAGVSAAPRRARHRARGRALLLREPSSSTTGRGWCPFDPTAGNALRASIRFPKLSALPGIIARLRRVFDLGADPLAIAAHLARDPVLAPLVGARPGLRVPGAWDGFELAIRAVLGQQIPVTAAVRLAARLVATYGEPLAEPDHELTHAFPRPEVLARADLTSLGMPRSRAATLSAVAAAVVADPDVLCASRGLDEAIRRLRSIPGVGEWTAHYIALRQLREPDAFPAGDVGLGCALARLEGRRRSSRELVARADAWRPWRAYAAQYLWASLRRVE